MEKFIYSQAIATLIVVVIIGGLTLIGKKIAFRIRMRKRFIERIDELEERIQYIQYSKKDKEYTEHDLLKFANDYTLDTEKDLFKYYISWKEKKASEF